MKCISLFVLALPLAVELLGCSKKEPEAMAASADAGASKTSASLDAGSARSTDTDSGGDPLTKLLGSGTGQGVQSRSDERFPHLGALDKIAVEKMDRPKNAVKVETVFDAIESKLKYPITRKRQVVAYSVKAGYCELGDIDPGITIGVCEYDDDKSLAEGRAPARMLKLPNREIVELKLTTVAIQRGEPTPEANAKADKIRELVKRL